MRSYSKLNLKLLQRNEQWMVVQHYSRGTKYAYRQTLQMFVDFLKRKSILDVTHLDVRKFLLNLSEEGVSLISARRHLLALRRFYDFLNLGGLVNYVPPRLVRLRPSPRKTYLHLSEEEVKRFIAAARTPRERALMEFFYATGCRLGEVCSLQIRDVDLTERTARVTGKFGKTRIVLLTVSAANTLKEYLGSRTTGYVFRPEYARQTGYVFRGDSHWSGRWTDHRKPGRGKRHSINLGRVSEMSREMAQREFDRILKYEVLDRRPSDKPMSPVTIGWIVRRIGRRAGLPWAHTHMLRHTFACHLHENGADLTAIQALLGHVKIESTAVYATLSAVRLADVFERCHPFGKNYVKGVPKHAESLPAEGQAGKEATPNDLGC